MKQFDSPEDDDQEQKIQKGLEQILTGEVETHLLIFKFIRFCGFALYGTVLFLKKKNQKDFRRMLTHPQVAGGPVLGFFFGPGILSGRDMRVFTPRAPENPDPKAIAKTEDCGA
ncbi:hypothetical protein [uncultured Rikenella sp.]|uniref:hypothetical protein n=1 Tax=uncultured Rikenella sp. TaxID=368003 RepID=UPI002613DD70|nr:hypothetical protein [uncultured Rikenella sp.]